MTDPLRELTVRVPIPWHKTEAGSCAGRSYYRWKPGVRFDDGGEDCEAVADGIGAMLLTEIGRYTPPGYRSRVFYTRQFVLPSGEAVGKPKLKVMGATGFTHLCRGWRYSYEVVDDRANVEMEPDVYPDMEDLADAASY